MKRGENKMGNLILKWWIYLSNLKALFYAVEFMNLDYLGQQWFSTPMSYNVWQNTAVLLLTNKRCDVIHKKCAVCGGGRRQAKSLATALSDIYNSLSTNGA